MLLKRKKPLSVVMRLRYALWPARSFSRSFRYQTLRLLRIQASPHSIAMGCAVGVFAVFTPFLGFQMTIAALLALALRGSVLASAAGSFLGNPLTYPAIWISTFTVGNVLLGSSASAEISTLSDKTEALSRSIRDVSPDGVANAVQSLWPILKPMALGSLPLGGITATLTYFLIRQLVITHKQVRATAAAAKRGNAANR
jgi:uncharacterized protein